MKLRVLRVDLPLKRVLSTSLRSYSVVRTIIVELEQDGVRGHGEVYESAFFGVKVEEIYDAIEKVRPQIEKYALADPIAFWRLLEPALKHNSYAQSAIDIAANDLWGKMRSRPLWKIWNQSNKQLPFSSYSLGHDSLDKMLEKFNEYPDWPAYKIRMGVRDDIEIIKELRKLTNAPFWIDAGGAWSVKTAIQNAKIFEELNIELIEQPLPVDDWDGMRALKGKCKIPLFADEQCRTEADLEQIASCFDGVHLKYNTCGGMTPMRAMLSKAKSLGLKTMMGGMIESTVGASAVAQLAPSLDYINLSGPLLIEKRIGTGVKIEKGRLSYSDEGGTGVRVSFRQ